MSNCKPLGSPDWVKLMPGLVALLAQMRKGDLAPAEPATRDGMLDLARRQCGRGLSVEVDGAISSTIEAASMLDQLSSWTLAHEDVGNMTRNPEAKKLPPCLEVQSAQYATSPDGMSHVPTFQAMQVIHALTEPDPLKPSYAGMHIRDLVCATSLATNASISDKNSTYVRPAVS